MTSDKNPIYLDYNATTPISLQVQEAMIPVLRNHFGNPSSSHKFGREAKELITKSRKMVADVLECDPEEVIFTSGGTESNNYAIKGLLWAKEKKDLTSKGHIVTSAVEHPAVTEVCAYLQTKGFAVTSIPVDRTGRVSVADIEAALRSDTVLISIMWANNEVGTLQPIKEIAEMAHKHGILLHSDASQAIGKVKVSVKDSGVDLLTLAGHKLYAPKGVGALYVRRGITLEKFMHGANHEQNLRAGTENVLEIVGLGRACQSILESLDETTKHMREMRDLLKKELLQLPQTQVNGHSDLCLPNTLSIGFAGVIASELLHLLEPYVCASAGAACHSEGMKVSHVLQAMQVPLEYAKGTLRLSTGISTTQTEVEEAARLIKHYVQQLRNQ